ncbi:MAG: hypothetical protein JXO22_01075 [Phycisphaerae bacterium]|nr:hypothetical protein [Phycisphaerae bacterium]
MKKMILIVGVCTLLGFGQMAYSQGKDTTGISIAPQTLLLSQAQSGRVTVHTGVPFAGQTDVVLEDIAAVSVYSDDCGYLVAKFDEDAVKAIVAPPSATLTLYIEGVDVGSDTVRVVE